jgi:putative NADH-flavin reductase
MEKDQMKWSGLVCLFAGIFLVACNGDLETSSTFEAAPELGLRAPPALSILVIGGTSGIGFETVKLALERGHMVTAMARRPERMTLTHERLNTMKGNILDPSSLGLATAGKDAVVIAIGIGPTRKPVSVFSEGTANVLAAMQKHDVRRLMAVTGIGAGDSRGHGGFLYDNILQPLLLNTIYEDKDRAEALIIDSTSEWTIVRPGFLNDDISKASYRIIRDMRGIISGDISRADTSHFIISGLETNSYIGATVLLTN